MHRLTSQAFELFRIALISGAMALIDVVAGRVLHAHPNPTPVLALIAGYWAASAVPGARSVSVGIGVGVVSGACYLVAFIGAAALYAGAHWAAPWAPSIGAFNWLMGAGVVGGYVAGIARPRQSAAALGRAP